MRRILFTLALLCAGIVLSQPDPRGVLHPYVARVTLRETNIVTTISDVKYLRVIAMQVDGTNSISETNHLPLRTNLVSITTNSTPRPE
jgi:hypothetical protein